MTEGTGRTSGFIRSNILGLIAIFIALSGTAIALPGKNKVDSGDIKNGQVKGKDLAVDAVTSANVAPNSLNGEDIDESSLSGFGGGGGAPSGPAGGDLAGTYPNPTVKETALDLGGELGGTAANATVDEAALGLGGDLGGTVANAQIAAGAVGAAELNNNAVVGGTGGDVQDGSLTGADIQNATVSAADIDETNLDAASVGGHQILSYTDNILIIDGMDLAVLCSPTNTRARVLSAVDNSKVYIRFSDGTEIFDADVDANEINGAAIETTEASGLVIVRFQNGATGRVVSAELAWRSNYASCSGDVGIEAFGRVIG